MHISYKKLWKLLIDRGMRKKDLVAAAEISPSSVTKLGRDENISTAILVKICSALHCRMEDILELVPDRPQEIGMAGPSAGKD